MTTVDLTKTAYTGAGTVSDEPTPLTAGQVRQYSPMPGGPAGTLYSPGVVILLGNGGCADGWWHVLHVESGMERRQPIDITDAIIPSDLGATVRLAATAVRNRERYLSNLLQTTRDEHEAFRAQVRELAIETKHEQDWCLEGLNQGLRALGLDEYMPSHEVRVSITVYATVEAENADAARDRLREYAESLIDGNTDDDVTDISTSEYGS